ncbi:MAG TPA: hypothetical protein VIQ02_09210, partial [Jiangellaceae bacterium]
MGTLLSIIVRCRRTTFERWFRELTDKSIRRGSFSRVPDLIASIEDYLRVTNANPQAAGLVPALRLAESAGLHD